MTNREKQFWLLALLAWLWARRSPTERVTTTLYYYDPDTGERLPVPEGS